MENSEAYRQVRLNSINVLTVFIEEAWMNCFDVTAFDEEDGVWITDFADTYLLAVELADKIILEVVKEY